MLREKPVQESACPLAYKTVNQPLITSTQLRGGTASAPQVAILTGALASAGETGNSDQGFCSFLPAETGACTRLRGYGERGQSPDGLCQLQTTQESTSPPTPSPVPPQAQPTGQAPRNRGPGGAHSLRAQVRPGATMERPAAVPSPHPYPLGWRCPQRRPALSAEVILCR